MATHDYVIDNQSASAFRADLNGALQAVVTQNSSATAPTTTYANMIWYDTANNQLKKRNEADSAWIILGTVNETNSTFTPSGERALASQAQAEAGTDNTTLMTPLRSAQANTQAIADSTLGAGQTWQDLSGGSRAVNTSYQNTTSKPIQLAIRLSNSSDRAVQVSANNSTWIQIGTSYSSWWPFTYVVVPVGYYYRVNGTASILNWAELR